MQDGPFHTVVGRYRVLAEIGKHTYGTRALAYLDDGGLTERPFELHVLDKHAQSREFVQKRMLTTAKLAATLRHPGVVAVYEIGEHKGSSFIAKDYVTGESLALVMRDCFSRHGKFPIELAIHVVATVAEVLHQIRDAGPRNGLSELACCLSPSNIVLTYDGNIVVSDPSLGASDIVKQTMKYDGNDDVFAYQSPEQARGRATDARSDVFSLGVLLWELATGKRLFLRDTDLSTVARILHMKVPPPSKISRTIPRGFDEILARALHRNPKERPQNAGEFAADLRAILAESGVRVARSEVEILMCGLFGARLKKWRDLEAAAFGGKPLPHTADLLPDYKATEIIPFYDQTEDLSEVSPSTADLSSIRTTYSATRSIDLDSDDDAPLLLIDAVPLSADVPILGIEGSSSDLDSEDIPTVIQKLDIVRPFLDPGMLPHDTLDVTSMSADESVIGFEGEKKNPTQAYVIGACLVFALVFGGTAFWLSGDSDASRMSSPSQARRQAPALEKSMPLVVEPAEVLKAQSATTPNLAPDGEQARKPQAPLEPVLSTRPLPARHRSASVRVPTRSKHRKAQRAPKTVPSLLMSGDDLDAPGLPPVRTEPDDL